MPTRKIQSPNKQKILLLLSTGLALGLTRSVNKQLRLIRRLKREWRSIDRSHLRRLVQEFYHQRLVEFKEQKDNTIRVVLTEAGQQKILQFNIDQLNIELPKLWDKKWRVVFFDIPERQRKIRDALRHKLRELGFYEWQKSVLIYPFPCEDEINFVVEFFEARPFVRYGELSKITNEAELKLHFNLK